MKNIWMSLVYIAFCGVIGFAIYITKSAWPLIGFLFTPTISTKSGDDKKNKGKQTTNFEI